MGGVGAHAAGVGAGVAVADALVVLGNGEGKGGCAVRESEEGELFAVEEFFEDEGGFGGSGEGSGEEVAGGGEGFAMGAAENHAFAGGEAVGFDDDLRGETGKLFGDLAEGGADGMGGGGDVLPAHEVLGEGLGSFEHGGGLGRAEDAEAVALEAVGEAERKGQLGADDSEGGALGEGEGDDGVGVGDGDGDTPGEGGDAGVAGQAEDLGKGGARAGPRRGRARARRRR